MEDNPIVSKSFSFALRIVKLSRHVSEKHKEFTLSREVLSSGTNIGRYVKAAVSSESKENFILNMGRALQHADITEYWLRLLLFAEQISEKEYESIEHDRKELAKMLTAISKTSKGE
jgi:four helix bundle protein